MPVRQFRVSNSTILRWVRRLRESGSYDALPMGGKKPFVLAEERDWLLQRLEHFPTEWNHSVGSNARRTKR